ncbi:MAG: FAD-dependent oxidoreductase, partial [Thermodesulfobacteriota bacterium]
MGNTVKIKTISLDIKGMTCDHCATSVEKGLDTEGVVDKSVSYKNGSAKVSFDESKVSSKKITQLIDNVGHYKVTSSSDIKSNSDQQKHLIIIGGGSAAFAATVHARELGAKVTMINDGLPIGGTCVNVGCIPSKNLIRAAETVHRAQNNPFQGISTNGSVVDFKSLMDQKRDVVLDMRQEKYINIVKDMEDFQQIDGRARITSATSVEVNGET